MMSKSQFQYSLGAVLYFRESFVKVLSHLALLHAPDEILKEKMEKMSVEIKEYEQLVRQLKVWQLDSPLSSNALLCKTYKTDRNMFGHKKFRLNCVFLLVDCRQN